MGGKAALCSPRLAAVVSYSYNVAGSTYLMPAVAAPGVTGVSSGDAAGEWWLPRRQQRELIYCLCMDCGKSRAFKDKHIKIPPVSRPALLHRAQAVVWEIVPWEYVIRQRL